MENKPEWNDVRRVLIWCVQTFAMTLWLFSLIVVGWGLCALFAVAPSAVKIGIVVLVVGFVIVGTLRAISAAISRALDPGRR